MGLLAGFRAGGRTCRGAGSGQQPSRKGTSRQIPFELAKSTKIYPFVIVVDCLPVASSQQQLCWIVPKSISGQMLQKGLSACLSVCSVVVWTTQQLNTQKQNHKDAYVVNNRRVENQCNVMTCVLCGFAFGFSGSPCFCKCFSLEFKYFDRISLWFAKPR